MYSASENNKITKEMALDFMKNLRRSDQDYVIDALIACTFHSSDYPEEKRYGQLEVSYFCRAFNITEYAASKQKNRIKGRYKKYARIPGAEAFLRETLQKQWPGYRLEHPRMDELLRDFANGTISRPASDAQQSTQKNGYSYSDYSRRAAPAAGHSFWNLAIIKKAVPWVFLLFLAVLLFRSCGHFGSGGSSASLAGIFSDIGNFLIKILAWIITLFLVGIPVVVFFLSRVWRNVGKLAAGGILYLISWSCFGSGVSYSLLFGCLFWAAGVCVWKFAK